MMCAKALAGNLIDDLVNIVIVCRVFYTSCFYVTRLQDLDCKISSNNTPQKCNYRHLC